MTTGPKRFLSLLVGLILIGSATCSFAQKLRYLDPGDGDILMMDFKVEQDYEDTFYVPMSWGERANMEGKLGIGQVGSRKTLSLAIRNPLSAEYGKSRLVYQEAAGQTFSDFDGFFLYGHPFDANPGEKTTAIVRCWPVGPRTHLGLWTLSQATMKWVHHITLEYGAPNAAFVNGTYSSVQRNSANRRTAGAAQFTRSAYSNAWKRTADSNWHSLSVAIGEGERLFGTEGNWFVLTTTPSSAAASASQLTLEPGNSPTMEPTKITTLQAIDNGDKIQVTWSVDDDAGPQFAYDVEMFDDATGRSVAHARTAGPDIRTVDLSKGALSSNTTLSVRLALANVLDVEGASVMVKVTKPVMGFARTEFAARRTDPWSVAVR